MTVNTTDVTSGPYTGNNIADTFSYTFRVENKTQLIVYETDLLGVVTTLVVDTDYTVNNIGDDDGGTIERLGGPLPTGYKWYIRSNYEPTQDTAFASQGGFFPEVHESAFDKLTFLVQQLTDKLSRTLRFSDWSTNVDSIDPVPDPESLKLLRWKADESGLENISLSEIDPDAVVITDYVRRVNSIAGLAALTDVFVGQKILLVEHTAGTGKGGGSFTGITGSAAGDNGVIVVTANGVRVRRDTDYVTPEMYGAVGSGDETAIIQNIIDSSDLPMMLRKGSSFNVSTITINKNYAIYGEGELKSLANSDPNDTSAGASNTALIDITDHNLFVLFKGIILNGNEANQSAATPSKALIRAWDNAGSSTQVLSINVDGVTFIDPTRSCITAKGDNSSGGDENLTVTNCRFIDGRPGIGSGDPRSTNPSGFAPFYINLNDRFRATITGNHFVFTNTLNGTNPLDYAPGGIRITSVDATTNVGGSSSIIKGNYFYGCGRSDVGYDLTPNANNGLGVIDAYSVGRDVVISGNTFRTNRSAAIRGKVSISGIIISSNIITDSDESAISFGPKGTAAGSIVGKIVINGNIIDNAQVTGIAVVGDGASDLVRGVEILGNIITRVMNTAAVSGNVGGIALRYVKNANISSNTIYDCDDTNVCGILTRECSDAVISSNTIENVGLNGVSALSMTNRVKIDNNDIQTCGSSGISITGTCNAIASNNLVDDAANYGIISQQSAGRFILSNNMALTISGSSRGFYIPPSATVSMVTGNCTNATTPVFVTKSNNVRFKNNEWQPAENYGTAAPSSGTWAVGDITWNTAPTAGGTLLWACTVAGTPGTWTALTLN